METSYDYIVCGGGTAGCIVAHRLTEESKHTVLLLEAGPYDFEEPRIKIPSEVPNLRQTRIDWNYKTEPQKHAYQGYKDNVASLARGKVKAFVYHCGLNGIWEAIYHGVPMVAVPLFADQFDNAKRIESRGMGVKVDIATLTSDELAQAIRTVVNNKSYKETALRMSTIFRDRPRPPSEEAADWIEYVIRHGGAKHLRSAALDLNVFQYFLLDVITVLLLALLTVFVILLCCCRLCYRGCRRVCGRTSKVKRE